jgi:hypothetical protein
MLIAVAVFMYLNDKYGEKHRRGDIETQAVTGGVCGRRAQGAVQSTTLMFVINVTKARLVCTLQYGKVELYLYLTKHHVMKMH